MTTDVDTNAEPTPEAPVDPLETYAAEVAEAVGALSHEVVHGTIKVRVAPERWTESLQIARDDLGLIFFSFLSAIEWTNEVAVGEPPESEVSERIEVIATVADITDGRRVTFSTDLDHDTPRLESLVEVYPGANWHEREAFEMFGIEFEGHPNLEHLYLPEAFIGHPLRKSFRLLSREVKPWPGTVDVEPMPEEATAGGPSETNPEA